MNTVTDISATIADDQAVITYRADRTGGRKTTATASAVERATGLPRDRVIGAFRRLADRGDGIFIVGRKGGETRLVWRTTLVALEGGRGATGVAVEPAPRPSTLPAPPESATVSADIPLRGGSTRAHVALPKSLVADDLRELSTYFASLADRMDLSRALDDLSRIG